MRSNTDIAPDLKALAHEFIEWLKDETSPAEPATAAMVRERFGIGDQDVRRLVHYLRRRGCFLSSKIGSDQRGYYWADDWGQIQDTLAQLRSRAAAIDDAVRGLCKAYQRDERQPELRL